MVCRISMLQILVRVRVSISCRSSLHHIHGSVAQPTSPDSSMLALQPTTGCSISSRNFSYQMLPQAGDVTLSVYRKVPLEQLPVGIRIRTSAFPLQDGLLSTQVACTSDDSWRANQSYRPSHVVLSDSIADVH